MIDARRIVANSLRWTTAPTSKTRSPGPNVVGQQKVNTTVATTRDESVSSAGRRRGDQDAQDAGSTARIDAVVSVESGCGLFVARAAPGADFNILSLWRFCVVCRRVTPAARRARRSRQWMNNVITNQKVGGASRADGFRRRQPVGAGGDEACAVTCRPAGAHSCRTAGRRSPSSTCRRVTSTATFRA